MLLPSLWKIIAKRFRRLMQSGRYGDALILARRYTRLHPHDPAGWIFVSNAQDALGEPERGLDAILAALERMPTSTELRWTGAEALMSLERIDEAEAALNELIQRDPTAPHGYAGRARLALKRGELEEAQSWADEAVRRINPAEVHEYAILLSVAATLMALPGELAAAEALFLKAARQRKLDVAPHLVLASIRGLQGNRVAQAEHRADARARWRGSNEEFIREEQRYEGAVERAITYAKQEALRKK